MDTAPAPPERPAPARRRRWGRRIGLGLLLGLVAAVIALRVLVLDPARLTPLVEDLLDTTLRGDVAIARVEWRPPLGVRAEGFVVTATTGAVVLSVDRVDALVDPTGLLAARVHVVSARVRGVAASLRRPSATRPYDLVEAFQPRAVSTSTLPPPITLDISDVTLEDVAAHVEEPGLDVQVRGATITRGNFSLLRGDVVIDVDLTAPFADVQKVGIPRLTAGASAQGVHVVWTASSAVARLAIAAAQLELVGAPRTTVVASGELWPLATDDPILMRFQASVSAPVAHPTVQAALITWVPDPSFLAATGTVTAELALRGDILAPTVTGTVSGLGLVVFDQRLDGARAVLDVDPVRVTSEAFVIALGGGTIGGRGTLVLESRAVDAELHLAQLPLAPLVPAARPYLPAALDGRVAVQGTLARLAVQAEVRGGGAALDARGTLACKAPCTVGGPETALDVAVELRHERLAPLVRHAVPEAAADRATLVARARGTIGRPAVAGTLRVSGARHASAPVAADAAIAFALEGPRLTLADAVVTSTVGQVVARGSVLLPAFERAGQALVLGLEVETTSVALGRLTGGQVRGTVAGKVRIEGPVQAVSAGRGRGAAAASASGALASGALASGPPAAGTAPAKAGAAQNEPVASAALAQLATATTALSALQIRLDAQVGALRLLDALDTAPFTFTARADGGRYTLDRTAIALVGGGRLTVQGTVEASASPARGATPEPTLDAQLVAEAVPLDTLAALTSTTPLGLTGTLDVALGAQGPLTRPVITADLEGTNPGWGRVGFSRLVARAAGPLDALTFEGRLVGLGGTLTLEGLLDTERRTLGPTHVGARNLALPDVPALPDLDGRLDAELDLEGPLAAPRATGRLNLRDVVLAGRSLGLDAVTAKIAPAGSGAYTVDVAVGRGLGARALLTLAPRFSASAFVEARELSLRPVFAAAVALGYLPEDGAITSADALLGATVDVAFDAQGLRARVDLRAVEFEAGELTLSLAEPAIVTYEADTLTLGRVRLDGKRGNIEVQGTAGDTLDLVAHADVNAAILSFATRQIQQATGRFTVDATVRGTRDEPTVSAMVVIDEPVSIRPRTGVREVVLNRGRIGASRERITVDGLDGEIGGGTFRLAGSVGLRGTTPSDFDMVLDGTSLPLRTRDLGVEANLNLRLRGTDDAPRLSGRLEIVRARYAKQFKLQNFVFVAERTEDGPTLAEQLPWLADLELDVRAQSAGDIELEVDASAVQVDLGLGADVTVTGTPLEPRLDGRIRAESGRLVFPRATLDVTTCDIDLDPFPVFGTSGITVRLVAEGEVPTADRSRTYAIRLLLEGPLEQLALDLQSAGLDRLAVLSLLITGRSTLDQEGALAFAGSQLAAPLTGFIEDQLEKALNLGLRLGAEVSTTSVKVTASKELTRRLVVEGSYQRDFDARGTTTTAVTALLYLFDRAFLEARASSTRASVSTPGQPVAGEAASTSVELKYQLMGQ